MKLKNETVVTVLPVMDMERAKKFYAEKLDLRAGSLPEIPGYTSFESGEGTVMLYKRESPSKADHTVASWFVDDIEENVRTLRARGIEFEQYDMEDLKTNDRGIAKIDGYRTAWFRDSENNILAITEAPS